MGTKSPSKFMSLSYLKELENNWYMGKNGKEYDIDEVNQLIWSKQQFADESGTIRDDIPEGYETEFMSNEEIDHEITIAKIFKDNIIGELLMEKALRLGKYDLETM